MGFINSTDKEKYGKYTDHNNKTHYGMLGLYDTDTDLCEFYSFQSKKRLLLCIDWIEIVKDEKEIETIKVLYDKN